ncbi:MAG: hypothetical protein WCH46_11475 [bacterium]
MSDLYTYGVYLSGRLVFSSEPMSEADAEGAAEWMRLLEADDSVVEVNECEPNEVFEYELETE